jgi:hypothetical protein
MQEQATTDLKTAVQKWVDSIGDPKPFAVTIPTAKKILGKSRSGLYLAADAGRLVFIKDGSRTLCTLDSIVNYAASQLQLYAAAKSVPPPRKSLKNSSKTKSIFGSSGKPEAAE